MQIINTDSVKAALDAYFKRLDTPILGNLTVMYRLGNSFIFARWSRDEEKEDLIKVRLSADEQQRCEDKIFLIGASDLADLSDELKAFVESMENPSEDVFGIKGNMVIYKAEKPIW